MVPSSVLRRCRRLAGIVSAPTSLPNEPSAMVQQRLSLARFINDTQTLYDQVALILSQMSLGYAVGVFTSRTNMEEVIQESLIVTQIPRMPLFLLFVLNCFYSLFGLGVGLIAISMNRSQDV